MTTSTAVSQLLTRWAHLYGHTRVSATVTYLHLLLGNGYIRMRAETALHSTI